MRFPLNLLVMVALLPAPAFAADERRLSTAEVQAILDQAARKRESSASDPVSTSPTPARPIEGEVGVSIGTGGYREVFGTAVVPVGSAGVAIISIDSVNSSSRHSRRRR